MDIDLKKPSTWPPLGTFWRHHSGRVYVVVDFTNVEQDRQDEYPTTIVYQNVQDHKKYSRRLVDWSRSMTPLHP